jgi:hypothetical protein
MNSRDNDDEGVVWVRTHTGVFQEVESYLTLYGNLSFRYDLPGENAGDTRVVVTGRLKKGEGPYTDLGSGDYTLKNLKSSEAFMAASLDTMEDADVTLRYSEDGEEFILTSENSVVAAFMGGTFKRK